MLIRYLANRLKATRTASAPWREPEKKRHDARLGHKRRMKKLATCQWLHEHRAPHRTERDRQKRLGVRARATCACRQGSTACTLHLPRLVTELAIARGDDRYRKLLAPLARLEVILLDDFGLAALTEEQRRDLIESLEDRYERRCTVVTSQYPVEH